MSALDGLTQNTLDPLDTIKFPELTSVPTPNPEYEDKSARLAAFATSDPTSSTIGADVDQRIKDLKANIAAAGDDALRAQLAAQRSKDRAQALIQLYQKPDRTMDPDGSIAAGARVAAQHAITENENRAKEDAIERAAIQRVQELAATDPVQAQVLLNNMEIGGPAQIVEDYLTKKLILEREINKAQIAVKDQGWMGGLLDFALSVIPFNYSAGQVGNVDYQGLTKGWMDSLQAGDRRRAEAAGLWDMPAADFSKYVREQLIPNVKENSTLFGLHDKSEQLNILQGIMDTPDPIETNLWNAADNLGFIGVGEAAGIGKRVLSIGPLMVKNGARKQAGDLAAHALTVGETEGVAEMAAKTGMQVDEVAGMTLPSAVNPEKYTSIPLAGEANLAIERAQAILKEVPEALPSDRFATADELQAAIQATTKRMMTEYERPLTDVRVLETPLASGSKVRRLELVLGQKTGGAFGSEKTANRYLSSLGTEGKIIKDESGGFFVKIERDMPETGHYVTNLEPGQGKFMGFKVDNPILNTINNARLSGDKFLADLAQHAGNKQAKTLRTISEPLRNTINKLKNFERDDLAQVMMKGEREGKWYSPEELDVLYRRSYNRAPGEHELEAYQAARDVNDIEFYFRNDDTYMNRVVKGYETASIDLPNNQGTIERRNAMVHRTMDEVPRQRVYNVVDGIHYGKDKLTKDMLEKLKAQGYVIVTFEDGYKLMDGTKIKAFLVKAKDAKFEPLRRDQLAYRPGGHRYYNSKYFSKQAVKRSQPDTMEEYLDSPNTYITGTKAEVDWWNQKMESARVLYKEMMEQSGKANAKRLDDIFQGEKGLPTGDEFIASMEKGEFEVDTPFVTLFDREMPLEYRNKNPDEIAFNDAESGFNGLLRTNGRMYYSKKGEQLKDWRGDLADVLDPFEAINTSLKNISNLSSFSDYKLSSIERWANSYKQYLTGYTPGASDITMFADSQFMRDTPQRVKEIAEKQRQLIRRTIGWKTDVDLKAENYQRQLIDWVNGDSPTGVRNAVADKASKWFDSNNPVAALRGFAFDMKLGLLNPVQLLLQASTMAASLALSPAHGLQGLLNMPMMRIFLTKSGTEHYLDHIIAGGAHTRAGFSDPKEYKAFMKFSKQSGFLDVGSTHGLINNWGPNAATSSFGSTTQKVREGGRFFFNEGETANRIVAGQIAWKELRAQFPELSFKDPEFVRKWEGRAEEYSFSMSSQSSAWWQNGVMSIPTQFWAYQMRMLEAMLGSTFTPAQRWRLAASQLFLYGSAGLPILPVISEKMAAKDGNAPDMGTVAALFDRGAVDNLYYAITKNDMQIGKRLSSGSWITDTVKDIFGMSQYGEKSFAELAGGATGGTIMDLMGTTGDALKKVILYSTAESGGDVGAPITTEDMIRLASNISMVNTLHKSYMVWKYNELISRKGQVLDANVPSSAAFAVLMLGAQPGSGLDASAHMAYMKEKGKQVDEAAKTIQMYRTRMLNEPENVEQYAKETNLYVRLLPVDVRKKALQRAHRATDPSLYQAFAEKVQRDKANEMAIKQLEQGQ